jgi:hypothetical protein
MTATQNENTPSANETINILQGYINYPFVPFSVSPSLVWLL